MVTNSGGPTRENGTASDGPPRVLPPLTRLNGYILLIVSFFGFWVWIGLNALVLLLLGLDQKSHANQGPLFVGLTVFWVLLPAATSLWQAPELLNRPLGPPRRDAKGLAGYLLRHSDEGVLGGPLELAGAAPPLQFWFVTVLFVLASGGAGAEAFSVVDGPVWKALVWLGFLASLLSLTLLIQGALSRRRSARRKSAAS
ncbi:hypothetical protein [Streptomyces sp. R35]|uniref:DUF4328 domain-containing protein n=1 Tax=Streptomyces sp. R35 TaxID=3238630 RepID=A0AB39SIQ8_9ACTN